MLIHFIPVGNTKVPLFDPEGRDFEALYRAFATQYQLPVGGVDWAPWTPERPQAPEEIATWHDAIRAAGLVALERMEADGIDVASVEVAWYDWLLKRGVERVELRDVQFSDEEPAPPLVVTLLVVE